MTASSRPTEPAHEARPGHPETFGKYTRVRLLGSGGFGSVWECIDTELQRRVAVKFLASTDPGDLARFQREARLAAALSHPNIVAIHDVGTDRGETFIVMDLIRGVPASAAGLSARDAARVMRDVADALCHAHAHGIIHRDLKPDNILVADGRPFVTDFGLAKRAGDDSTISLTGEILGTPRFMAPEQARGDQSSIGPATDVYMIGSTLYALTAGKPPFDGAGHYEVLRKVIEDDPPPPPVDRDLRTIVLKCLEKEPLRRYPTARAVADDLQRWLDGATIHARPPTPAYRLARSFARYRALWALAAALLVTLVAGAAFGIVGLLKAERAARERADALERAALVEGALTDLSMAERRLYEADLDVEAWIADLEAVVARLRQDRPDAGLHYQRGRALAMLGRIDAAEEALSDALELAPDHGPARFERARVRLVRHFTRRWSAEEPSDSLDPVRTDLALARLQNWGLTSDRQVLAAYEAYSGDRPEELRRICRTAIDAGGRAEEFHALLAVLHLAESTDAMKRANRVEERRAAERALAEADAALRRQPNHRVALMLRGGALLVAGRGGEAVETYERVTMLMPEFSRAVYNLGMARAEAGDFEGAIREFTRAIELEPMYVPAWQNRAAARASMGRWQEAIDDCDVALRFDPNSAIGNCNRATLMAAAGDLDGALGWIEPVIERLPDIPELRLIRANLRFDRGDPDGARAELEEIVHRFPGFAPAHARLGRWHLSREQFSMALPRFNRALELDASSVEALSGRAVARGRLNDLEGAIADLDAAIEMAPGVASLHFDRGSAYLGLNRHEEAVEDLSRAIALQEGYLEAYVNRGVALAGLGDRAGSIADLRRALQLAPGDWPLRGDIEAMLRDAGG